jgi:uncharacterized membrane protein (DUF441 family)
MIYSLKSGKIKRNDLRKFFINMSAFVAVAFICSVFVFAAESGSNSDKISNPIKATSLSSFFDSIVSVAIQLGTIVSVLGIMYGGFQYVSAQGDEEKIGKARNTITWALVGTAVLLGARTIMAVVNDTVKQLQ